MIAVASLNARYLKATASHPVTIMQPLSDGTCQLIFGHLLGEMHIRGRLHHYRVSIGNKTILLVPPEWLHSDSRIAVLRAGLTIVLPSQGRNGVAIYPPD